LDSKDLPQVLIGSDVLAALSDHCAARGFKSFHLVADPITYSVLGRSAETTLLAAGMKGVLTILEGFPLVAGGEAILQVLTAADPLANVFVAVGSGTVTDVVRFASRCLGRPFISVPTAPSVDAYTSPTSPLVVADLKQSFPGQLPLGVFAHLHTLCAAPAEMISAGFGDMLGKYTALADWKLGSLLWDEPYDKAVAGRARHALQRCIQAAGSIAAREPAGIQVLMECQLESGLNMARVGSSRPASGAEHHLAHYWEMKMLWEGRPPLLHGTKVGFAALLVAEYYSRMRQRSFASVRKITNNAPLPNHGIGLRKISQYYSRSVERIVAEQKRFLELEEVRWDELKLRLVDCWEEILEIARAVPEREEIENILQVLNFPVKPADLQLTPTDVNAALAAAHYLRDRMTVLKLASLVPGLA